MELNGIIKETILTTNAFQITCELIYEGQQAAATFAMNNTPENFTEMMKVSGKPCWEQLPNTPIKLRLINEAGNIRLDAIGHFMIDYWLIVPKAETEPEAEKESE